MNIKLKIKLIVSFAVLVFGLTAFYLTQDSPRLESPHQLFNHYSEIIKKSGIEERTSPGVARLFRSYNNSSLTVYQVDTRRNVVFLKRLNLSTDGEFFVYSENELSSRASGVLTKDFLSLVKEYDLGSLPEDYYPKALRENYGYAEAVLLELNLDKLTHSYISNFNFPTQYAKLNAWTERVSVAARETRGGHSVNRKGKPEGVIP